MEVQDKHQFKWILISSLICAAIAIIGFFLPVALILIPLVVAIVWVKQGIIPAVIPYLIFALLAFFLFGELFAILFVLISLPASIAAPILLKQKRRLYESVLITSFATVIGCLLFTAYVSFLTGENVISYILNQLSAYLDLDNYITQALYLSLIDIRALSEFTLTLSVPAAYADVTLVQMKGTIINAVGELLPVLIPSIIMTFSLACGFISFYGAHAWLKKHDTELVPVAKFCDLRVPRTASFALGIMVLVSILLRAFGLEIFSNISAVLMAVFVLIFSVQGCALFVFLYKTKRIKLFGCIMLILFGLLFNALVWIGFFEALFRIRERINMTDAGNRSL